MVGFANESILDEAPKRRCKNGACSKDIAVLEDLPYQTQIDQVMSVDRYFSVPCNLLPCLWLRKRQTQLAYVCTVLQQPRTPRLRFFCMTVPKFPPQGKGRCIETSASNRGIDVSPKKWP